jgi:thioesterase domain-containing protein/acyl carrier protein
VEKIGMRDNFFELGGHSLIAVQIITKVENETGNKLPLAIFFKYPTIEQQVASIEKNNTSSIWKSLVPIKETGNKVPLYIVHGDGLNVLNFGDLARHVDEEQPVFGLQARGLDGIEQPMDDITEIARHYINEILEHNPAGPYAIGGYSFGGYVAIEMRKQLEAMGKKVKMLAIFDTNAINAIYNKNLSEKIFKKITRQVPKFFWFTRLFFRHPKTITLYQLTYLQRQFYKMGLMKKPVSTGVYAQFDKINEKHLIAFKKYRLAPFDDRLYLFKSRIHIYFIDDQKYLGWAKYAKKGVLVYDVPGDHKTMFEPPNVKEFAGILQRALDSVDSGNPE